MANGRLPHSDLFLSTVPTQIASGLLAVSSKNFFCCAENRGLDLRCHSDWSVAHLI
jgi:hypothetical protein